MPHLAFDLNFAPKPEEKKRFAQAVVKHFSTIMDTGTDHIGITLRCYARDELVFGRAEKPEQGIAFLDADIRLGRTRDQKRRLALAVIDELHRTWGVPKKSVYVVYTEHDGEHFQLEERVLPSWSEGEDPLAGPGKGSSRSRPKSRSRSRSGPR
jgi:phenylpyruvate tautomerase PptA (4-oxalocrotonate tautomerase family)